MKKVIKNNYIFNYITFVSLFSVYSYGQKNELVSADKKKYVSYSYIDTNKTYERLAERGYKSVDMFQKLGNSYYFNSEFEKAVRWYCELFTITLKLESEYYFRYAVSLKSIGDYEEADKIIELLNLQSKEIKEKFFKK
jgi:tetratricopeptide (TPR) repeat protein